MIPFDPSQLLGAGQASKEGNPLRQRLHSIDLEGGKVHKASLLAGSYGSGKSRVTAFALHCQPCRQKNPATEVALEDRVRKARISRGESAVSTASTVPASSDSVQKSLNGAGSSSSTPVTPPVKVKRSNTDPLESETQSAPKGRNEKLKSKQEVRRSPTVHYSPKKPEEASDPPSKSPARRKATAVKAKAAPKNSPQAKGRVKPKANASPKKRSRGGVKPKAAAQQETQPDTPELKAETPGPESARAVQSALARKTTVEIAGTDQSASDGSEDEGAGGEGPSSNEVLTAEEELYQYLVWDVDAEEDEEDVVTTNFFESIDKDKSPDRRGKGKRKNVEKNKRKSKKRKSTSSGASSDSSDDSDSSSESESPALKKVFLQELLPLKTTLDTKRETLLKGGDDIADLEDPEEKGEKAVKSFNDFLKCMARFFWLCEDVDGPGGSAPSPPRFVAPKGLACANKGTTNLGRFQRSTDEEPLELMVKLTCDLERKCLQLLFGQGKKKLGFIPTEAWWAPLMCLELKPGEFILRGMWVNEDLRGQGLASLFLALWLRLCLMLDVTPLTDRIHKPILSLVLQKFGFVAATSHLKVEVATCPEGGPDEPKMLLWSESKKLSSYFSVRAQRDQGIRLVDRRPEKSRFSTTMADTFGLIGGKNGEALAEHGKGMARHFEVSSGERIMLDGERFGGRRAGERLYTMLGVAKQFRVSEDFGSIDVFEVRCTTELPPDPSQFAASNCWGRCRRRWKQFNSTALDRMSTLEIHSAIVAHSFLSFNHLACIIIASAMAGIGLITDSSVFVLAAFFVSPLMQMVLATVWGLTVSDYVLAWRGCRNMLLGAATCLLYGAMFGAVLGSFDTERDLVSPVGEDQGATSYISINTLQISSRGPPRGNVLMSGIIAGLSGVAIGLGQGSGIASALIGVCISTSLLPPLVNAGMMWALQLYFPEMHNRAGFPLSEPFGQNQRFPLAM
eukprot:s235_g21.t1